MPSLAGGQTLAAQVFALHPLQMEAVRSPSNARRCSRAALFSLVYSSPIKPGGAQRRALALRGCPHGVAFAAAGGGEADRHRDARVAVGLYEYTSSTGRLRLARQAADSCASPLGAGAGGRDGRARRGEARVADLARVYRSRTSSWGWASVTAYYLSAIFMPVALSPIFYYQRALALRAAQSPRARRARRAGRCG
jgi:hypothetical protein